MANKNFKPEKSASAVGRFSGIFSGAIGAIKSKDATSKRATADPWAKKVNQRDWESPVAKTDDPNDDLP